MRRWKPISGTALVVLILLVVTGFQRGSACGECSDCDECEDIDNCNSEEEDVHSAYGPGESDWDVHTNKSPEGATPTTSPGTIKASNVSSMVPAPGGAPATGSAKFPLSRALRRALGAATTPGRKLYILDSFNERLIVWDTATQTMLTSIVFPGEADYDLHRMDITPDGTLMFVPRGLFSTNFNSETGQLLICDLTKNTVAAPIALTGDLPIRARVAPDGALLYLVNIPPTPQNGTNAITAFDIAKRAVASHISLPTGARDLDITPDATTLYVTTTPRTVTTPSGPINAQVIAVDTLTGQVATSIDIPAKYGTADKVVVSPDGAFAYVTTVGSTVNVIEIDTITNKMIAVLPLQAGATTYTHIDLTPDGLDLFVSSRAELFLHHIDTATYTVVGRTQIATQPANGEPKWGLLTFSIAPP